MDSTLIPERSLDRARLLEGENEALRLIIDGAPLATVLEHLTLVAERQAKGDLLASILLLDADRVHLRHGAAPSLPAPYTKAIDGIAIGPAVGSCGTAAFKKTQVIVSDIETDPLWSDFRDLARQHGLRACWSTPILSPSRAVLGTFALYYRYPRSPEAEDQEMIEILTRTAALAIDHARAGNELAESEERFRSLSRCAPLGVFMLDAAGAFSYVNPRFVTISKYEYEKTFEYWLEKVSDRAPAARLELQARHEFSAEFDLRHGGEVRSVSLLMAPMRSRTGEFLGYAGTLEDISARVESDTALRRETALRRAIEESMPAGIAVVSPDGTLTYVNRGFAAMLGRGIDELTGARAPYPYWPREAMDVNTRALEQSLRGEAPETGFELSFERKDGERFPALVRVAPVRVQDGGIDGWVASVLDMSRTPGRISGAQVVTEQSG